MKSGNDFKTDYLFINCNFTNNKSFFKHSIKFRTGVSDLHKVIAAAIETNILLKVNQE